MLFRDDKHEAIFVEICSKMRDRVRNDCYHQSMAYLIALDVVCREHIEEIFDFTEDCIKVGCLGRGWQTGTSMRTVRFAFNLWNDCCTDGENYIDSEGYEQPLPSSFYTPSYIFCCSYAPYYCEALKLRYPEYMG